MKVLLLIPTAPPSITGNAATAARWTAALAGTDVDLRVVATDGLDAAAVAAAIAEAKPDLLHVYHAWKVGRLLMPEGGGGTPPLPWVVSIPGTDLSVDAEVPERRAFMRRIYERARVLVTPSRAQLARFTELYPDLAAKARIVPKGVRSSGAPFDLRVRVGAGAEDVVFLLPAGIRRIKGIDVARDGFILAAARHSRIRWALAGPLIEPDFGEPILRDLAGHPWACALGPIPPERMGSALREADVVVNASRAEGISNAVVEGMAAGLPILASDIPGNREVVTEGVNGLLFRSPVELAEKAVRLAADPELRRRLGEAGRKIALEHFAWERERDELLGAYRDAPKENPKF